MVERSLLFLLEERSRSRSTIGQGIGVSLGGFWPNAPRSGVVARAQVELVPTASPQSGCDDELSHNFRARTLAQRLARAIRGGSRRYALKVRRNLGI